MMDNNHDSDGSRLERLIQGLNDRRSQDQDQVEQWLRSHSWLVPAVLILLAAWVVLVAVTGS